MALSLAACGGSSTPVADAGTDTGTDAGTDAGTGTDTATVAVAFTLTTNEAILTNVTSSNVTHEAGVFLDATDNEIDALNRLGDDVFISDATGDDSDVLNATLLAPTNAPAPTIQNIETLNVESAVAGGKLSMGAVTGTDFVNISGDNGMTLSSVVQDGSVDFSLNSNVAVTLEAAAGSATTDAFNLSVEGAAETGGSIALTDSTAGSAVTIATVDLESAGSTTNIVTIDSTTTSDYDGIAALNITGAAGLDLTTDFAVKTEIDASELTGALDLNLVAATDASVDISEYVTGTVTNLTLTDYAFDAAGVVVDTTSMTGLESVTLAAGTASTSTDLTLNVDAGVGVNLTADDTANDDARIAVTDAATTTADVLALGIGGAAAVDFAVVTAASVERLDIASTTSSATAITNTIDDIGASGASAFTTISASADADADLGITNTYVAAGTQAATNTVSLITSGDGDVALGKVNSATSSASLGNVNAISLTSADAGARSLEIEHAGNLKSSESSGQAAGTGVSVSGAGTGEVTVTSTAAILSSLAVDATDYAGDVTLLTAATTGAINAVNFDGVDEIVYTGNRATDGITNLGEGVVVTAQAATTTLVSIGNATGVTENTVKMEHDAGTAAITTLTANGAKTLNIETVGGARTTAEAQTVGTLNATAATEINITADEFASFVLTNAYTTVTPAVGVRDVVINLDGAGAIDFDGGITASALDTLTINSTGTGSAISIDALTVSDLPSGSTFALTGDRDVTIDDFVLVAADGETFSVNSAGTITLSELTSGTASTIAASKELTFDVNGAGAFVISDAVDLVVNDGSILTFTGDMDVTVGASEATSLQMLTATKGDGGDFDASGLSGDLTLFIQDTTSVDDDEADILLGTGESTVTIYGGGTSGARVVDDGFFIFKFNTDGIADTNITGLLSTSTSGENNDVLSFAGYGFGTADEIVSLSGTRSVVENGDDEQILEITDVGSSLEITSLTGAFDGVITLSDHTSVADLTIANFDF